MEPLRAPGQGRGAIRSPCSAIQHPLCDVLAPYPVALVVRVDPVSRPVARRGPPLGALRVRHESDLVKVRGRVRVRVRVRIRVRVSISVSVSVRVRADPPQAVRERSLLVGDRGRGRGRRQVDIGLGVRLTPTLTRALTWSSQSAARS